MRNTSKQRILFICLEQNEESISRVKKCLDHGYNITLKYTFPLDHDDLKGLDAIVVHPGHETEKLTRRVKKVETFQLANYPPVLFLLKGITPESITLLQYFPSSDFVLETSAEAEIEYRLQKLIRSRSKPHVFSLDEILSGIFDQIQEKVMVVDHEHRIVFVNPGLAKILEKDPNSMIGEFCYNFKELLCGIEEHERADGPCGKCKKPVDERPSITKAFHVDGETKYFEISTYPVHPPGEDTPLCLRCFKDVTSRVLLEKELRGQANKIAGIVEERTKKLKETKEYLEHILEATHDLFFTLNLNKEITYLNRNVCHLGYEPEELLGKSVDILFSGSTFCHFFESVIKKKEPSSLQVEFVTRSGEIRPHVLDAYPLFSEQRHVVGVLGVSRDITEKKAMEKQLLENAKFSFLGQIATGLAHEIKNPLAVIEGTSAYCIKKEPSPERLKESFQVINRNVTHAQRILNDLLDFARPRPLKARPYRINSVIQRAMSLVAIDLERCNVEVTLNLSSPSPIVICDEKQLNQVFLDLVWNARQAMPEGGSLIISTTTNCDVPSELFHPADVCPKKREERRQFVRISFSDSGVGIDEKSLEKIFEPFFTSKPKGLGLGLSICKRIIRAHGGTISAKSKVGEGTTVSIFLPVDSYE